MYLIKQSIRAHLFVNFAVYKYLIIIIIRISVFQMTIRTNKDVECSFFSASLEFLFIMPST